MLDDVPFNLTEFLSNTEIQAYGLFILFVSIGLLFIALTIIIRQCFNINHKTLKKWSTSKSDHLENKQKIKSLCSQYNKVILKTIDNEDLVAAVLDNSPLKISRRAKRHVSNGPEMQETREGFMELTKTGEQDIGLELQPVEVRVEVTEVRVDAEVAEDIGNMVEVEADGLVTGEVDLQVEVGAGNNDIGLTVKVDDVVAVEVDDVVAVEVDDVDEVDVAGPETALLAEMDDEEKELYYQTQKAKAAIIGVMIVITRLTLYFGFLSCALGVSFLMGSYVLWMPYAILIIFFIFVFANIFDACIRSSRPSFINRLCYIYHAYNEVTIESLICPCFSILCLLFICLALMNFGIVSGESRYGFTIPIGADTFSVTSQALRKFSGYNDNCNINGFCELYITLPNEPLNPSTAMVVNLFSKQPPNQKDYDKFKVTINNPNTSTIERRKLQKLINNNYVHLDMKLYYGTRESYDKNGNISEEIEIPSIPGDHCSINWVTFGGRGQTNQIHSVLLNNLKPDTEYKLILNVNGYNITENHNNLVNFGSVFKTMPEKIDYDNNSAKILITGNMPQNGELEDRYYTDNLDALIVGGNFVNDSGEMNNSFLWTEMFSALRTLRSRSQHGRLLPFAIAPGTGETGYNIDTPFANAWKGDAHQNKESNAKHNSYVYKSNQDHLRRMNGYNEDNEDKESDDMLHKKAEVPLYRYFIPQIYQDKESNKPKFRKLHSAADSFAAYNIAGNLIMLMDSGYLTDPIGTQIEYFNTLAGDDKKYHKKFAVYHRSLYPFCKPWSHFDHDNRRDNWEKSFQEWGLIAAYEMGDGGFRMSRPIKDRKPTTEGTKGAVVYIGQGNMAGIQSKKDTGTSCADLYKTPKAKEEFFEFYPKVAKGDDIKTELNNEDVFKKSYWILQLSHDNSFTFGTNGDIIPVAKVLE